MKFSIEHSSKELPFLDILKTYLPQTNRHPTIPLFQKLPPQKLYKILPLRIEYAQ